MANKKPRFAFRTHTALMNINATHNASGADFTRDGMTTMKWKPAASGISSLSFVPISGTIPEYDYIALAGINWDGAGVSLDVLANGVTSLATFTGLRDNDPVIAFFTARTGDTSLKFEFTCSNTSCAVGEIYFGKFEEMPLAVSSGYQPGVWTNSDELTQGFTEGNQFGPSTILKRGTTEQFELKFLDFDYMNSFWKPFSRDAHGKPVFFCWDDERPQDVIYGHWEAQPPKMGGVFSSLNIKIKGVTQ